MKNLFTQLFYRQHCLPFSDHCRQLSLPSRNHLLAAILTLGFISPGWSDDDDWRRLHEDVQAGKIKPLNEILASLSESSLARENLEKASPNVQILGSKI